jgi:hypothetical protein
VRTHCLEGRFRAGARSAFPLVFLASPQCSSFITGEVLPIIGGYAGG